MDDQKHVLHLFIRVISAPKCAPFTKYPVYCALYMCALYTTQTTRFRLTLHESIVTPFLPQFWFRMSPLRVDIKWVCFVHRLAFYIENFPVNFQVCVVMEKMRLLCILHLNHLFSQSPEKNQANCDFDCAKSWTWALIHTVNLR